MDASSRKGAPAVSWRDDDGRLAELVYEPASKATAFALWNGEAWTVVDHVDLPSGDRLVPYSPKNNLIKNEAVVLPSEPAEYGSERELADEIGAFIHCYVDLSPAFERIASYYVLLTWLYDAFKELPYLRFQGDYGTGKTRALLTVGSICYKAFFASGASTVSPIFHILDAFRGTLVLDEADFRFSDEKAEIVKILNNGTVDGMPVLRTVQDRQKEFNPRAFKVFGPKIVSMRGSYEDKALESRFLTEGMGARGLRSDIPINVPERQRDEARLLRNKLLLFRFRNRGRARLDPSLVNPLLEPRLNQILVPLLSIVSDGELRDRITEAAAESQRALISDRSQSAEAQVLEILAELMNRGAPVTPLGEIATTLSERYGGEFERPISSRWIGSVIRRRLGLRTYKRNGVFVVPLTEKPKVDQLCRRYGLETTGAMFDADSAEELGSRDLGTSGTS